MNRESWFPDSYNRCLENFLQAFVPQIISRLKDQPQIAKVCFVFVVTVVHFHKNPLHIRKSSIVNLTLLPYGRNNFRHKLYLPMVSLTILETQKILSTLYSVNVSFLFNFPGGKFPLGLLHQGMFRTLGLKVTIFFLPDWFKFSTCFSCSEIRRRECRCL